MPDGPTPEEEYRLRHAAAVELQASLMSTRSVEEFLQGVVDRAGDHIAPHSACTLTAHRAARYSCAASSDEKATQADLVEYVTSAGPCVEAVERGVETVVPDLQSETRWPEWAVGAGRLGFKSAAAVPSDAGDGIQLALNVYCRVVDAFGEAELARMRAYAEEAARALRLAYALAEQAALAEQLESALASRSTIDQAIGVIMGQNRIPADEAFAILRGASQHRNVKLREVAAAVIESLTGQAPSPPPDFRRPEG
jgi:GAF domain-containing protein